MPAGLAVKELGTTYSQKGEQMFNVWDARGDCPESGRVHRPASGREKGHADDSTPQLEPAIEVIAMRDAISG